MVSSRVVVTGMGFITSIGNSKNVVLSNLKRLKGNFKLPNNVKRVVGIVKSFNLSSLDTKDWVYPKKYRLRGETLRALAPQGLYCYCSAIDALQDSKISNELLSSPRIGLFTASAGSPRNTVFNLNKLIGKGFSKCSPFGMVVSISGTLTFNLVALFKIKGSSCCFVSACSSSGHALGYAHDEISTGKQDVMLVSSGEDGDLETILPFAGMRALSTNCNTQSSSKPFDTKRCGFVGSGGGVTLILEELYHAKKRKAPIYGEFVGWGKTSDGFHKVAPEPNGEGLYRCVLLALKNSKVNVGCIDYINAHATSTSLGDLAEIKAFKRLINVVPKKQKKLYISSTKGITGHCLSMASILESGVCMLSLKYGVIPGSSNIELLDKNALNLNIIRKSLLFKSNLIINTSSGFGGSNTCLVFKKLS